MNVSNQLMKLAPPLVTLLMKTLRIEISKKYELPPRAVYVFWHGKMLAGWWILRDLKPAALVSMSKDGELLSKLLKRWGYNLFRGSSSAGGKAALTELSGFLKNGNSAVITPDGPRGPAKHIKNGALILSFNNKIPIIPLRIEYCSGKVFEKSWDNFEVPYPFSTCKLTFGEPRYYSRMLDDIELDDFKAAIAGEM
jgi:hypothetical protein